MAGHGRASAHRKKGPGGAKAGSGKTFLLIDTVFSNTQMPETLVVNPKGVAQKRRGQEGRRVGHDSGYNVRGMRGIGPGYGGKHHVRVPDSQGFLGLRLHVRAQGRGKREKLQWGVP